MFVDLLLNSADCLILQRHRMFNRTDVFFGLGSRSLLQQILNVATFGNQGVNELTAERVSDSAEAPQSYAILCLGFFEVWN